MKDRVLCVELAATQLTLNVKWLGLSVQHT